MYIIIHFNLVFFNFIYLIIMIYSNSKITHYYNDYYYLTIYFYTQMVTLNYNNALLYTL